MLSIFSFLGSTVFRLIFGEIMAFVNKKLEHQQELERMKLQNDLEDARATRLANGLKLQAELEVKVVEAKADARADELDGMAFLEGVKATMLQTGIRFIDGWNAGIRPGVATWAVIMLTCEAFTLFGITQLDEDTRNIISAALGLFLADRSLRSRGK